MKKLSIVLMIIGLFFPLFSVNVNLSTGKTDLELSGDFILDNLRGIESGRGTKSEIHLEDCVNTGNPGEAKLPVFTKLISLPATGNFVLQNIQYDYDEIALDHDIISVGTEDDIPVSVSYYTQNKWLPEQVVKISEPNIMRSYRFSQVAVAAVQYNPALKKIRILKDIDMNFTLDERINTNSLTKERPSAVFDKIAAENILGAEPEQSRSSTTGQYLIIAPDLAANDLNQFIRSKEKLGFRTKLVLLSETGSN
ncbi:MAG TPA: C25 family peptidase propeptide domain-containing protein, partial [Candidatus Cloacimonadota bacterium]|nr:C25 family peptidase propeptide domain-containing protein [Candidatus Cloacimonadota bacterium]